MLRAVDRSSATVIERSLLDVLRTTLDPDTYTEPLAHLRAADRRARTLLVVDSPFPNEADWHGPRLIEQMAIERFDATEPESDEAIAQTKAFGEAGFYLGVAVALHLARLLSGDSADATTR